MDENSGKEKDICLGVGGGLANFCDARILDRLPKGRAGEGWESKIVETCAKSGAHTIFALHRCCPNALEMARTFF